jgi:hypothetical protein
MSFLSRHDGLQSFDSKPRNSLQTSQCPRSLSFPFAIANPQDRIYSSRARSSTGEPLTRVHPAGLFRHRNPIDEPAPGPRPTARDHCKCVDRRKSSGHQGGSSGSKSAAMAYRDQPLALARPQSQYIWSWVRAASWQRD